MQSTLRKRQKRKISPEVRRFLQTLTNELGEEHGLEHIHSKRREHWDFKSDFDRIWYNVGFAHDDRVRVRLSICRRGKNVNRLIFDRLIENQSEIERAIGDLEWERETDGNESRISLYRPGKIDSSSEVQGELRAWMIEHTLKFRDVFEPLIDELGPLVKPE